MMLSVDEEMTCEEGCEESTGMAINYSGKNHICDL